MSAGGSSARPAGALSLPFGSLSGKPPDGELTGPSPPPPRDAQWGLTIPSLYSGHSRLSLLLSSSLSCLLPCSCYLNLLSSSHILNSALLHTGFLPLPANTELNVGTGSDNLGAL